MVKSRRAASAAQSSVKATVARRPSVETSWRSVVTSTTVPDETAVTVPWAIPVGIALIPACFEAADHFFGRVGRGEVEILVVEAEQSVAHRAADEARAALFGAERGQQPLDPGAVEPAGWDRVSRDAPRQVDEHRRGRAPDAAAVPDDFEIMAHAALVEHVLR